MSLRSNLCSFLFLLSLFPNIYAEDIDYRNLIGLNPERAIEVTGPPAEIYIHRGGHTAEDDIVFFRDGIYLFWFENRIWQVRADSNAGSPLAGIMIGESRAAVVERLGRPEAELPDSLLFRIENYDFPLRLRVVFDARGQVEDIYLYRSDY